MSKIALLSCSLNPGSSSRVLARYAFQHLKSKGLEPDFVDLQDMTLPFAGASGSWDEPAVAALEERLQSAQGILVAAPIYTYDLNAAAKNVLELCGGAFENKVVGFLCSAGGMGSYMSVMPFANSLMLDFRSLVIPRYVYALKDAVSAGQVVDPKVKGRIEELCAEMIRVTSGLQ